MTREQEIALADLRRAVEFFDKVKASTGQERAAVGRDHWDWLESAARNAAEAFASTSAIQQ